VTGGDVLVDATHPAPTPTIAGNAHDIPAAGDNRNVVGNRLTLDGVSPYIFYGGYTLGAGNATGNTIVFKKDKVKIGEQDYNYTVDGPKSKDAFTYYSLKVKDQGKETSYTVFFPTKSKEVALFLEPNDEKEPLKGQMLFALNKKDKPDYYSYVKKYLK